MPIQEQVFEAGRAAASRFINWMQQANDNEIAGAKALPLRHDMVTLLTYVRANRFAGTQSTGDRHPGQFRGGGAGDQGKPLGRGTTRELVAFQITFLGKGLLEAPGVDEPGLSDW